MNYLIRMIKESIEKLEIEKVIICYRNECLFSEKLSSQLNECKLEVIKTKDKKYTELTEILNKCEPNQIIIMLFPLFDNCEYINKHIFECCMSLEKKGIYMINITQDIVTIEDKRTRLLYSKLLLNIINHGSKEILINNKEKLDLLGKAKKIILRDDMGTNISFKTTDIILQENYELTKFQRVIQIPCGEVFLIPEKGSVNGELVMFVNKKIYKFKVINDIVKLNINEMNLHGEFPICEIGFGTNPFIPDIEILPFREKKLGTFHIGFGCNTNFGGKYNLDYHFDLVFNNPKIIL